MNDLGLRITEFDDVPTHLPLGRILVNAGKITQSDLVHALKLQRHVDAPLGEILVTEGLVRRCDLLDLLSQQHEVPLASLSADPPEPSLCARLSGPLCLQHGAVPWMEMGETLLVATSHPERFNNLRACFGAQGRKMLPVLADDRDIRKSISALYGPELATRAAQRVPAAQSCRSWASDELLRRAFAALFIAATVLALLLAPLWAITAAMLLAFVTLLMSTGLKLVAAIAQIASSARGPDPLSLHGGPAFPLPRVSVLVPLLEEKEIAEKLIGRLSRLTYPKSLLEVVLVLEAEDEITRDTIARTNMPDWLSVIEVPGTGTLKTKPRALNYALDFCQGSIIGVWDAEDAPEPDQIEKVVTGFHEAPPDVACLQGMLDYYNPRSNWLARCFTIEYATWWRMILPGVARLGLVIPLGGTTLFFRRHILEELCGWDAHNVTEDADLGVRLARAGYTTRLIPTVTFEEANCRPWPWIKQRSRWLKGYLITWMVHMRNPAALLRDLGMMRFLGVQTLLLATFAQFAFAPLLWSFWITLFGFNHPVALTLGQPVAVSMAFCFLVSEVINLTISMIAVSQRQHRHLLCYVLTLPFYFPMAALSAYKALKELVQAPFYWDKTMHGIVPEATPLIPLPRVARLPASDGS
ncbi:glycosyltransferase family 2 protein [Sulfitobacter sp. HNIBRBA3233]|uniref:glycosyltransferase family 2 protein n=1 Tax=Sulfitobacter marinivivus TaxID=3158558 RepID=UPI0032DEA1EB